MTAYHLRRDALKIAEHFPGSECSIHQAIDMLLDQDASRLSGRPQGRDKDEEEENEHEETPEERAAHLAAMNARNYTMADAERAKAVLARDFIVGVTEKMDEFVVLLSLELGWAARDICKLRSAASPGGQSVSFARRDRHANHGNANNTATRYRDLFPRSTVRDLEAWLEADVALHSFAETELSVKQADAHGGAFLRRLEEYRSAAFATGTCAYTAAAATAMKERPPHDEKGQEVRPARDGISHHARYHADDVFATGRDSIAAEPTQGVPGEECGLPQARARFRREHRARADQPEPRLNRTVAGS